MGGGLMQLVSYGAQDIYISGNPQITFWKVLYKRHTNFAVESIEVTFNGQADFNKRVTAIINRNADLMYKTYIQVVLPQITLSQTSSVSTFGYTNISQGFRWLNYIGHRLIKQVEIEIGGQRIDRQYGDWMQIWTQLSTEAGTVKALDSLVGNTHDLVLMKRSTGLALDATCSAAETTVLSGAFATTMPWRVAAGTSTLSTPTPARPITFRLVAFSMRSAVIFVADRMTMPS